MDATQTERERWLEDRYTLYIDGWRWQSVDRWLIEKWQMTGRHCHPPESTEMLNDTPLCRTAQNWTLRTVAFKERNAQCNWRFLFLTKKPLYLLCEATVTWDRHVLPWIRAVLLRTHVHGYLTKGPVYQGGRKQVWRHTRCLSDVPKPASLSFGKTKPWVLEKRGTFHHFTYSFNSTSELLFSKQN